MECPACGATVLVGFDARAGQRFECGKCGTALEVEERIAFRAVRVGADEPPKKYERLGRIEEVSDGNPKVFRLGNREIAVFQSGGRYFAVKNLCPHHGVQLSGGSVVNHRLRCPGHGFQFDLETGQCDRDPSLCASTFELKVQDSELFVRL